MTLHHFRKEARYLLPRWLPWLALLLIDLAINLEWIAPLRPGHPPAAWIEFVPVILWSMVFWLISSNTPEDAPTNPNRFIATRPIHRRHYWGARILVLFLLFILPLALQETLYLLISGRPPSEIWTGTWHQAAIATALFAWALPFKNLWRGWQHLAAITTLILSGFATSWLVDALSGEERVYFSAATRLHQNACLVSLALFAVALTLLLPWKKWHQLSLSKRLPIFASIVMLATASAIFSPIQPTSYKTSDQAAVDTMSKALSIKVRPTEIEFMDWPNKGARSWLSRIQPDFTNLPGPIQLVSSNLNSQAIQDSLTCGVDSLYLSQSRLLNHYYHDRFDDSGASDRAVASLFPSGTLLTTGQPRTSYDTGMIAASIITAPLPDPTKPVNLSGEWQFAWQQWQVLTKIPLNPQTKIPSTSPITTGQWQILNVRLNQSAQGDAKPGAVSIDLKSLRRPDNITSLLPLHEWPDALLTVLYAPDRRIAWVLPSESTPQTPRAPLSHWKRQITALSWHDVLRYKDGSPAHCDPNQLELWIINKTMLGTSRWKWQPPPLRLVDHLERQPMEFFFDHSDLYEGRELEALNQHLATLPTPAPDASKTAVHDYLNELLIRINAIDNYSDNPAVRQRVIEVLTPIAQKHLDLLLDLPQSAFHGHRQISKVVEQHLTEAHRDQLIDQLPNKPQFASLISKRQWTPGITRVVPALVTNSSRIDRNINKLLITLNDPIVHTRLVEEMRSRPDADVFEQLIKIPLLQPALAETANEGFRKVSRVLQSYHEQDRILIAVRQGDPAALDLALLWSSMAGETGANQYHQYPTTLGYGLARTLGLIPQDLKTGPPKEKLWPLFRALRATDFRYLPAERRWEKAQP